MQASAGRALSAGQLVVLFGHCDGELDDARTLARQMGTWLEPLGPFASGGLSRSATPGLAAVAACRTGAVGVDVECIHATVMRRDEAESFMHPAESASYLLAGGSGAALAVWTRKEAVLKAFGTGLAVSPTSLQVGLHDTTWAELVHPLLGTAHVMSLHAPTGYVAAVAARTRPASPICLIDTSPVLLRAR
jgi:phosphopantetheinyl transferase